MITGINYWLENCNVFQLIEVCVLPQQGGSKIPIFELMDRVWKEEGCGPSLDPMLTPYCGIIPTLQNERQLRRKFGGNMESINWVRYGDRGI